MKLSIFIKNFAIIAVIMTVVFLSQMPDVGRYSNSFYSRGMEQINGYGSKLGDWFKINIYPRVGREVEKRKSAIEQEIDKQKSNLAQMAWEKFKNYFAEKFSNLFGTKVE